MQANVAREFLRVPPTVFVSAETAGHLERLILWLRTECLQRARLLQVDYSAEIGSKGASLGQRLEQNEPVSL